MDFADPEDSKAVAAGCYSQLAAAMAHNSIYHSVSPARFDSVSRKVLIGAPPLLPQPRVVVVVGAGASNAASGLPCGSDAAKYLRDGNNMRMSAELVEAEIGRLMLQFNLDESDFETVLLALNKFDREALLEKLRLIYGRRHHPWLGFELLAHGLKHRFIDAIVNFNFDEILDQAIEDELGERAYYKAVLDGDCPADPRDWLDESRNRFRYPLYIKPHGSASQPSSMRFTRESYTTLSEGFVKVLSTLFSGEQPVYVLVLGFAMQSIEFNHLLRRAAASRTGTSAMKFFFVEKEATRLANFAAHMDPTTCELKFPRESLPIDRAVELIWEAMCGSFTARMRPRGIERHRLVSELFKSRAIADWKTSVGPDFQVEKVKRLVRYCRNRTLVEIALAVAKAKGFASLEDLADGRVGTYFRLYREHTSRVGGNSSNSGPPLQSIKHACEILGLREQGYGGSAMVLPATTDPDGGDRQNRVLDDKEFDEVSSSLARGTLDMMLLDASDRAEDKVVRFKSALMEMFEGEEVEVAVSANTDRTLFLESAESLATLTALKLRTEEVMNDPSYKWDAIVCTAKTGQWLRRDDYRDSIGRRGARLALVVADRSYEARLRATYGNRLVAPVRALPWWLHNRHVTVFLNGDIPKYAISFERRLRTARIAPLFLTDSDDVRSAWHSFVAYWFRAERFGLDKSDREVGAAELKDTAAKLIAELTQTKLPSRWSPKWWGRA